MFHEAGNDVIRLTGQVPPLTILSKVNASGIPAQKPEPPEPEDLKDPLDDVLDTEIEDPLPAGLTYAGRR